MFESAIFSSNLFFIKLNKFFNVTLFYYNSIYKNRAKIIIQIIKYM